MILPLWVDSPDTTTTRHKNASLLVVFRTEQVAPDPARDTLHQRAASGSNKMRRRVRVACAKRSNASVEGRTLPPSIRAM